MTFVRFLASYHRTQKALKWWSCRQSTKLFLEAEKIRDGLLQESFTIRRTLELLPVDHQDASVNTNQDVLKKIDNFHHSLAQLSDRLFPAYLPDSLPMAIECVLEPWETSDKQVDFNIDLPTYWRHEPAERSLIILSALEELLRITLPEGLTQTSIYINLKQQKKTGELMVQITYPDISTLALCSSPELGYLSESFRFLTSGKCFYRSKNLSVAWYFCWN